MGLPISPALSSVASSALGSAEGSVVWEDAVAEQQPHPPQAQPHDGHAAAAAEEARGLAAVVVGNGVAAAAPAAVADKEEGAASWWARARQALRPRKLKEKLLSFCVGVVHGVAGVRGILDVH